MTKSKGAKKAERVHRLLDLLADGEFHSGESLGESLEVSRAAIWKLVQSIEDLGLKVDSVRGKGYRISGGLKLLSSEGIGSAMSERAHNSFHKLEVFKQIDSTNQYLLDELDRGRGQHGAICLAEQQSAGRGRRGRSWVSPFAQNIYCSVLWRFDTGMAALEGLSLVVGLAITKAIEKQGISDLKLKWPNDILARGRKLAGVLLELRGDVDAYSDVVIGFGINVNMLNEAAHAIDQPWIGLAELAEERLDRNPLIASVLSELAEDLSLFEQKGFAYFVEEWNQRDAYSSQVVQLISGDKRQEGLVCGVNSQGALVMDIRGERQHFFGGEISLRPQQKELKQ